MSSSFLYYYPNRPILIPPDPKHPLCPQRNYIDSLEALKKYKAEQKWNGDNVLIYTEEMAFWNRHKELHHYKPSPEVIEELSVFPKKSILNAELVHNRTKTVKHTIIVHCVMAWKGQLLAGKTWGDSRQILEDQQYGEHVVLSRVWDKDFWELFQQAEGTIIEGIILKDPRGKLQFSATPLKDVSWMLKIRKPSKKYPW